MRRTKYTEAEIKEKVENESSCLFVETYMESYQYGTRRFLKLVCACGNPFEVQWVKFNRSDGRKQRQCKKCGDEIRRLSNLMTETEYIKLKEDRGIEIRHTQEFKGRTKPINHKCPSCGNEEWKVSPNSILSKASTQCATCWSSKLGKLRLKNEEYYQAEKRKNKIDIVNKEPYAGADVNIIHVCSDCKGDWLVAPKRVLNGGNLCEPCSYKKRSKDALLTNEIVERVAYNSNCIWIGGIYEGKDSKLLYKCGCGTLFQKVFNDFRNGSNRCNKCCYSIPNGEYYIMNWLKENDVPYKHQQRFDNLKGKRNMPLSYDFSILSKSGDIISLIEYDGEHHFRPIHYNSMTEEQAFEKYENVIARDKRKNEYAKDMGIPLIRLNGKQYKKLDEHLKHLL